jgi:hypothetical protein
MSWRKMMMGGEVEQDDLRRFILVKPTLDEILSTARQESGRHYPRGGQRA